MLKKKETDTGAFTDELFTQQRKTFNGIPIRWHRLIDDVPEKV